MSQRNNVNVNVLGQNNNYNVNDIGKYEKAKRIEFIADQLVQKFGNSEFRGFYCKVAYKLSESRIWQNYETASRGNNPARLFTWLCKRDGV